MPPRFDLLVFDWDGTLMDSAARIVSSFQAGITELGLPARMDDDIRQIIGLGLSEAIRSLYPEVDEPSRLALRDRYRQHYLYTSTIPTPMFPGATETLRQLNEAGYLLAVATGKSRTGLNRALEETGLGPLFLATRTADETSSKPDPLMLREIMAELDTPAARTLMIGDSEYDLLMADNAGTASLAVSYGVHEQARLLARGPLACLAEISELTGWLGEPG
jgi:phosphoglycolate phosphatase